MEGKVWMSQSRSPAIVDVEMRLCASHPMPPPSLLAYCTPYGTCNGLLRAGAANQGACRAVPAAAATGTLGEWRGGIVPGTACFELQNFETINVKRECRRVSTL
jgi:hypothetical protein